MPTPRRSSVAGRLPLVFYTHPFELAIATLFVLSGAQSLTATGPPNALELVVPHALVIIWQAGSIAGGALVSIGVVRRADALGRALEKAGLYVLAGITSAYGYAIAAAAGWQAAIVVANLFAIAAGCLLRAGAIRRAERVVLEQLGNVAKTPGPATGLLEPRNPDGRP